VTLRARLAWTYGIAVAVAVIVVALVSVAAIDRALRSSLDARLRTAAGAIVALVDVKHGALMLDAEDRIQMDAALAGSMDAVILSADGREYAATTTAVPETVREAVRPGVRPPALFSAGNGGGRVRAAAAPIERGGDVFGSVAVWAGSDFIDEFDRVAVAAMGLAALLGGGIVIVLSQTLARRALAPLERLSALATEIEAHDLSRRLGTKGSDELGQFGAAFDRMLDRLEQAFARQRRFTADASHELRAPLAVIRTEADVTLARDRSSDEYRAALATIASEVERIDALVAGLLAAARADSEPLVREPVKLRALAERTAERFGPTAQARGVSLGVRGGDVEVCADERALERALASIVHNALEFARTSIEIDVSAAEGEIAVTDDGAGFSPEGLAHATERFWREDPSRTRGGGSGLGLSIASAIVAALGGAVRLANARDGGARVTIRLPRSS
jgi:signal transduction histidine kinase